VFVVGGGDGQHWEGERGKKRRKGLELAFFCILSQGHSERGGHQ